jgi:hypothetical protein
VASCTPVQEANVTSQAELGFQVVSWVGGERVCSPVAWTEHCGPGLPFVVDALTLKLARQLASGPIRRLQPRTGQGRLRPGLRAADAWEELVPAVASVVGPLHAFSHLPAEGSAERYVLELPHWNRWIWRLASGVQDGVELLRVQFHPGLPVGQASLRFAPGLEPFPGVNGWPQGLDWPEEPRQRKAC